MNNIIYFEIQANDLARAMKFYESIFDWKFTKQEGLPIEYWQIATDGINGGLLKRPVKTPGPEQGTNAFINSIEVENFDAVSAKILAGGGQVAMDKFAVAGKCWQGYFLDAEGNTFGLVQVDTNAK